MPAGLLRRGGRRGARPRQLKRFSSEVAAGSREQNASNKCLEGFGSNSIRTDHALADGRQPDPAGAATWFKAQVITRAHRYRGCRPYRHAQGLDCRAHRVDDAARWLNGVFLVSTLPLRKPHGVLPGL